MILSELLTEVYSITKRPDKVDDTTRALRAAVLECHTQDFYSKDIFETGIVFASSGTEQSFQYKLIIPRWRAVSYIQPLDSLSYSPSGPCLKLINPQFITDEFDYYKDNVFYEAGQILQFRTYPGFQYFQIGAYLFPDVSSTSVLQTWITQDFPYAVIYDAASRIFRSIGFTEQMNEMKQMAAQMKALISSSNIQAIGY